MFTAIKLFMSDVWIYLKPLVFTFISATGQTVLKIAIDIVSGLEAEDLSSSEKREQAFNRIKGELEVKGVEAKTSIINAAIEIAVQKLKSLE